MGVMAQSFFCKFASPVAMMAGYHTIFYTNEDPTDEGTHSTKPSTTANPESAPGAPGESRQVDGRLQSNFERTGGPELVFGSLCPRIFPIGACTASLGFPFVPTVVRVLPRSPSRLEIRLCCRRQNFTVNRHSRHSTYIYGVRPSVVQSSRH